jgi:hypothetical protein
VEAVTVATWMPADAWIAAVERDRAGEPFIPRYQRAQLPPPAQGGSIRRAGLTGAQYHQAADLARDIGVRAAARRFGVSHVALLQGWARRKITVIGPTGRRRLH